MAQPGRAVQVHMITGATVTALVLEDTLFKSARKVGRDLGIITEKQHGEVTWHTEYAPRTWQELLAEGSIGHLRVAASAMASDNEEDGDEHRGADVEGDGAFVDLYFGDLRPPVIGINMLGESTYNWMLAQLEEGQTALFIVNNGTESFKGSGFVRGGIFDRFNLDQGLRRFTFKDLDYENLYDVKAEGAPRFRESGLFFLRDPSFRSTEPWTFNFLASRLTGETARSKEFRTFSAEYRLPAKYFDVSKPPGAEEPSLIQRIWSGRRTESILLTAFLLAVMGVFFARRWVTRSALRLEIMHNTVLVASVVIVGLLLRSPPSVTQIFPFVRMFEEGGVGFGLFLSDPLLFIFWIFIAVSLLLWGRGWFCGWVCPYGAMLELMHKISRRVLPKRAMLEFPQRVHDVLRRVRYGILIGLVLLAVYSLEWAEWLAEIEPFKTTWIVGVLNREWYFALYWWALLAIAIFNFRFFCRYLCPLGAALSIGTVLRLIGIKRKEFCTRCKICARGCDSRAINPVGQINKYECLYCLECEQKHDDDMTCPPLIIARRQAEKLAAARPPAGTQPGAAP
jgi:NosR/NirI family nitrous oxide reductase transcriptional regulator